MDAGWGESYKARGDWGEVRALQQALKMLKYFNKYGYWRYLWI
jgi:hypothetical protein